MKFAGTNWTTTEQVAKVAQKSGLKLKHKKTMKVNKKTVWRIASNMESDEFTLTQLFYGIKEEIKSNGSIIPTSYRFADVLDVVTDVTGIQQEKLKSSTRIAMIKDVRHVAMYLVEKYTRLNLSRTGELFNRDHSTVLHAKNRVKDAKQGFNPELKSIVDICESCLVSKKEY